MKQGFTDKAAIEDQFQIDHYISGLTTFIENCNTPMTIAIQGEWGSGKTSVMNMVEKRLNKSEYTKTIFFNTWQYSQFNMGDELTLSFLNALIEALDIKRSDIKNNFDKIMNILRKAIKPAGMMLVEYQLGSGVSKGLSNVISACGESDSEERKDTAHTIKNLRREFENCISESLKENNKKKLVVFVDDLDRLNPGKAVELLEVLKIFLECPNCVFVLAIDYGVVSRGVKEKYGDDFEDEKGKSFFDKIIQVPFKLPVANYNIYNYVKKCLSDIAVKVEDSEINAYIKLINCSIGNNPRSIKRLFNSFLLLNNIVSNGNKVENSSENKSILFAVLCMQNRYEQLYNYLVGCIEDIDDQLLKKISDSKYDFIIQELKLTEDIAESISDFCQVLYNLLSSNDKIEETKIKEFCNALKFSTITSSGNKVIQNSTDAQKTRYNFWKSFEEYAFKEKEPLKGIFYKPNQKYTVNWYALRWGNSRIHIELTINTKNKKLSAELYTESSGRGLYEKMYVDRLEINKLIKQEEVTWTDPAEGKKICKIKTTFAEELNLTDESKLKEAFDWLIDTSENLYHAIESYLN